MTDAGMYCCESMEHFPQEKGVPARDTDTCAAVPTLKAVLMN